VRESAIEKALLERVCVLGGVCRKVCWPGRKGAPDRFVMLPGTGVLWVELKRPGKSAEAHQLREHKLLQSCGQRVVIVSTLAELDEVLPI